ncbi:hypothetical protein RchiOBHm_Chr6g0285171 [Rosa chinensis]|uniref:Uncharacterized protein n=1 Tax=Rosa chinensis TaxID=74649 RepID=A0A2P6PUG6_ROSCH|nr:hypothetical protein RchiOBHm_Chr6g0285171 [Rosa chinensis]
MQSDRESNCQVWLIWFVFESWSSILDSSFMMENEASCLQSYSIHQRRKIPESSEEKKIPESSA